MVFALFDLVREGRLLLALLAGVDLVALLATVEVAGARERVFIAIAIARVICLVKTSAYRTLNG